MCRYPRAISKSDPHDLESNWNKQKPMFLFVIFTKGAWHGFYSSYYWVQTISHLDHLLEFTSYALSKLSDQQGTSFVFIYLSKVSFIKRTYNLICVFVTLTKNNTRHKFNVSSFYFGMGAEREGLKMRDNGTNVL